MDPCPCGSGRRFQELLHAHRSVSTACGATITTAIEDSCLTRCSRVLTTNRRQRVRLLACAGTTWRVLPPLSLETRVPRWGVE
ncbi:MAG: SEC-C metal-binding domain-containing protein [Betaproteobacteria bacterium]|nr:SEC-C domain-containing protein [Betaproteobacteria bacterium]